MKEFEDQRGTLVPIAFDSLDFSPAHAFLVTAKDGATRGGHAHRKGCQLLLRVSGEIDVAMTLGTETVDVQLDAHNNALLITSPVWSSQTYHGREPALLVLSDRIFDPANYVVESG